MVAQSAARRTGVGTAPVREEERMPVLDDRHDLPHPVEADGAWSESWYFNAYDPPSGTGFFTRIGVRPNEGTMDAGLSVWLPGGGLGEYRFVREPDRVPGSDLRVGAVSYRMLEPMRSWRVGFDGEVAVRPPRGVEGRPRAARVELEAEFSRLTPAVGTEGRPSGPAPGAAAEAASTVGRGHLEQAGRWSGTVTVDGAPHRWSEARGNRDRSWGPRRWGGPLMWRWFSINLGDEVHFGGIRIGTPAGDLHRGWVWDGGGATSIREWRVRTETEEDGVTQRRAEVLAVDKKDRQHRLAAEVLRVASIGPAHGPGTLVNEGLARWACGDRTGYGIAEYLHQLDGDGRPAVAVE
jgi:hypothetical protein